MKFYEKVNTLLSQFHIAHIQALIHVYTYIDLNKSATKLILSLCFSFSFLSKNSCLRSFITFLVCNVGYLKWRHSMSKSFCWLWHYLSYRSFKQRLLIYCYRINIYSKTAFYSQPIKNVHLIILKNQYLWKVIFILFIYLFKFCNFVLYCQIILKEYLFLTGCW